MHFYLVLYLNVDQKGNFVLMRHDRIMDKPKYFSGTINDTIRRHIDSTFLNDSFATDYSYMTNPNFVYDGFTYCFDYQTEHNKRKKIQFIPRNSPAKIHLLNTIFDTLIYSLKSESSDTLNLTVYNKELKQLFKDLEPPPKKITPSPLKVILFKPPKSSK